MSEYVSRVLLDIDGQSITDFKSVSEKEVELNKEVRLMNKSGFMRVTPRYGVDVEYVMPLTDTEFNFTAVRNGRLSIENENGKRTTFTGVYTLKIGDVKYDGDNEATRTISLGAVDRLEE